MPPFGSTAAVVEGRRDSASPGRSRSRSISTRRSNGRQRSRGARARSGSAESPISINQWFVANHQPPSLRAIIPWEGFADLYRDALFHGGLLSLFMPNWYMAHLMHHVVGRTSRHHPNRWHTDTLYFWLSNNLDSGAFRGAQAQWDRITVPMFSVGNWTGMGLHLRGNTEAFTRAATPHKKLRIHAGTHVHPFYSGVGRRDQLRFFDYWLKGEIGRAHV